MELKLNHGRKTNAARRFLCQTCDREFSTVEIKPSCPNCGAKYSGNIVPIYVEDDNEKEQMYTSADWVAGD